MPAKPQRPIPDDFAEWALDKTQDVIRAKYGCGAAPMLRWVRSMTPEWRAARKAFFHAQSAERYKVLSARGAFAAAGRLTIQMPEGFAQVAATMTRVQVGQHFKISATTVHRLVKQLTPEEMELVRAADNARRAINAVKGGEKSTIKRRLTAVSQRRAPAKVKKTPGKASGVNWGFNKPTSIAPAPGGVAAQAAQHLRRYYVPVFRGDVLSKALAGRYVVGKLSLDEAAMIELARSKGFDQDAWRQVA
jgi:hypothetical protein